MKSVQINMQFKGMRKPQSFIIYPCLVSNRTILIQSDQRIGRVNFTDKTIFLSKGRPSGSYGIDLCTARGAKIIGLTKNEMQTIEDARDKMLGHTNKDRTITLIGA